MFPLMSNWQMSSRKHFLEIVISIYVPNCRSPPTRINLRGSVETRPIQKRLKIVENKPIRPIKLLPK